MWVYCSYIIGTLPILGQILELITNGQFLGFGVSPDFKEIKFSWINHNFDIYNAKTMKNLVVWGAFEIYNPLSLLH